MVGTAQKTSTQKTSAPKTSESGKRSVGRPKGALVENTAQRRRQLVEAAINSIVELGMSKTTLASVAKSAGLSQGVAVFYFQSKANLLAETLIHHYQDYTTFWQDALAQAGADPFERLLALVFADLDPAICTSRNLALWNSFWGEALARPRYAAICEEYDSLRAEALIQVCEECEGMIGETAWDPQSLASALDSMTDGFWIRLHITPEMMDRKHARATLSRFLTSVFPDHAAGIQAVAEA